MFDLVDFSKFSTADLEARRAFVQNEIRTIPLGFATRLHYIDYLEGVERELARRRQQTESPQAIGKDTASDPAA